MSQASEYIKQINRINRARRAVRVLVRLLVLFLIFGGLGYWSGFKSGRVAGAEDVAFCESSGSGYFIKKNGDFICIFE